MEFHLSFSTIVATSFSVIVALFLLHSLNRKKANRGKNQKPPQAQGAWPIIGHLHLLRGSQLPHYVLGDMADKYGPIFTIKLGYHQALVVSNGSIAKECFTTNDKAFATRPKAEATKLMGYNYAMFGFATYGDYWRQARKMITLEVLSQRRVETFAHIRASEVRVSIKDIYDRWVLNKMSENSEMMKIEMSQWFGNLVVNIMVRIIRGKTFSPHDDQERVRFQTVVKKFIELMGAFVVSDFIPYLKCFDMGGYIKEMKKMAIDLDNIFGGWLQEHKTIKSFTQQHESNQLGFIDVLISILQGVSKEEFRDFDDDTIIKSACKQLLIAGLDTTSGTLTWALSLLLNHPKTLEIAQNEIDEHVGRERLVEESDLKNLVYLNAIIKETLRLYTAAPLSIPHESIEDCIVGGYNIPKGTRLVVNVYKMHRDPNIWSDPLEFRPERFLTRHKDIDFRGKHYELLPFGSGRRMCPGIPFALQAVGLTLASFIQQFVLKNPSNEPIDMSETSGLTISKSTPLEVLLAPRLASNMY
ncbi:cytochrome P450 CYP82D47 [Lactuca sativa]|uniref:Cytochrome P450 n=1 Tax=Lactuca sativa TaxID=4236 RepID=A0A9R1VV74_LACSA|nr:cytochrome P450 CYP82D47 [Lactuca sativa]KAJ0211148.1 hypothetical protein LSAT_V11C400204670 [Lactuca sativa]